MTTENLQQYLTRIFKEAGLDVVITANPFSKRSFRVTLGDRSVGNIGTRKTAAQALVYFQRREIETSVTDGTVKAQ